MIPYRIVRAVLTTYSGKRHEVKMETGYFTEPVRKVKEKLLDGFCAMCKRTDPFVAIEIKTKTLFVA